MKAKVKQYRLGARKTFRPAAATFARNDLLFTMSDNTHKHDRPWWARMQMRISFTYEPGGSFSDGCLRSKEFGRQDHRWWSQTGSNRRPPACKAGALPAELWPLPETANIGSGTIC